MENTERNCCICGSTVELIQLHEKFLCEGCLSMGIENRNSLWTVSLEMLIKEYTDACLSCLSFDDQENINKARILGRKIQSVLLFLGLPKKHTLLIPIRKVHLILKTYNETDVLLDEIAEQNEENKVNAEMVKLLTKKQKDANELLSKNLPKLINDSYYTKLVTLVNDELNSYNLPLVQEKALHKYEERFNALIKAYEHSVEVQGKTSPQRIKNLQKIQKKARSLGYIYSYLNDIFGDQYMEKELYYKEIQRKITKAHDMKDLLYYLKTYEKKIDAPKKEKTAIKKKLKERMKVFVENIELQSEKVKEG